MNEEQDPDRKTGKGYHYMYKRSKGHEDRTVTEMNEEQDPDRRTGKG